MESSKYGEVLSIYSRKDALEDEDQFCLSDRFPQECKVLTKLPLYCTKAIWWIFREAVESNPRTSWNRLVGEMVWTIKHGADEIQPNESQRRFTFRVKGAEDQNPDEINDGISLFRLVAEVGPKDFDDPEPAMTISRINED